MSHHVPDAQRTADIYRTRWAATDRAAVYDCPDCGAERPRTDAPCPHCALLRPHHGIRVGAP